MNNNFYEQDETLKTVLNQMIEESKSPSTKTDEKLIVESEDKSKDELTESFDSLYKQIWGESYDDGSDSGSLEGDDEFSDEDSGDDEFSDDEGEEEMVSLPKESLRGLYQYLQGVFGEEGGDEGDDDFSDFDVDSDVPEENPDEIPMESVKTGKGVVKGKKFIDSRLTPFRSRGKINRGVLANRTHDLSPKTFGKKSKFMKSGDKNVI